MPPALLSRFDIMWLMLDKAAEETDKRLAEHIINLHQGGLPARVRARVHAGEGGGAWVSETGYWAAHGRSPAITAGGPW
jgi:DNA replicative helicase MCM subunit Mcm2 (Cdc46/Mcm family)